MPEVTEFPEPEILQELWDIFDEVSPATRKILAKFAESFYINPKMDIDEWADLYYFLPEGTSSEFGLWRTERFAFLREPMKLASPSSPCREIDGIKGAQLGWTEFAKIIMCYTVAMNPQPLLYIQKTKDDVEEFSKLKLQPTLEACPTVWEKLHGVKNSKGNHSILLKTFDGGFLAMGGANTANSVSSKSIGVLLADEIDRFAPNVQQNGDPLDMAIARCRNYPDHKIIAFTTPAIKETSRITKRVDRGDQRHLYYPCPHCNASAPLTEDFLAGDRIVKGTYFTITWDKIKYVNDDPTTAACLCTACGQLIEEHYKTWMLDRHLWIPHNPQKVGQKPGDLDVPRASFVMNSLYSPLGFFSWADAVDLWLTARKEKDDTKMQVFVNTVLGEGWSVTGRGVVAGSLESRKRKYSPDDSFDVPGPAVVLLCGTDVQPDRIECEIVAYGAYGQTWSIDYHVFYGETQTDDVWYELDQFLLHAVYRHQSGRLMNIYAVAVDSGYNATTVYKFCSTRMHRKIVPVKGDDGWGKGLVKRPDRPVKGFPVKLYIVWVDEMKSRIYANLRVSEPGPRYCNFPDKPAYDERHFAMLSAETLREKTVKSQKVLYWHLPDKARNEALDCRGYAEALVEIFNIKLNHLAEIGAILNAPMNPIPRRKVKRRVISKGL